MATAYLWAYLFSNNGGIVNTVLGLVGIQGPNWLYSTEWSLPTLVILSCWNVGSSWPVPQRCLVPQSCSS